MNHKCPFSLDGPESSTEWAVGKGIAIYFIPAATLLIPHYQASEPEVLGEAAGPPCMLAMLIPHYRAFEPEVLGEAVGCFADPAFLRLGASGIGKLQGRLADPALPRRSSGLHYASGDRKIHGDCGAIIVISAK